MKCLSIIIPVYNEKATIKELAQRVKKADLPQGIAREIIIVDDGSNDGTREILQKLGGRGYKIFFQDKNRGKGSAVRRGLKESTGDFVVVQDADLEYNPQEYVKLLEPILAGKADVVYGSRFLSDRPHRVFYYWHYVGNKILTQFSNMLTNLTLTDMETCYKMFTREVVNAIKDKLKSNRFGIEPEITSRVKKFRVYELGITYNGRTYSEGKKINWKDGFAAFWAVIRFNFFG